MHISPIPLKLVPVAVAALLGGLSATAFAAPVGYGNLNDGLITLEALYRLPQNALITENGMDTNTGASIYSTANGADMYRYTTDSAGNNVFFHTYGFTADPTYFGARASGEGSFYASTDSRYSRTFTNNTLLDQLYNFAFNVADGEAAITGAGAGFASLMLQVNITTSSGTTTVARDSTTLTQAIGGGRTCAENDVGALAGYLGCDASNNFVNGGMGGLYNVNLGSIAAGQSFTLDYDIIATVSGDLADQDGGGGYGGSMWFNGCGQNPEVGVFAAAEDGDGYGGDGNGEFVCEAPSYFPGMAIARSGDPFNGPNFGTGGPSDFQTAGFSVTGANAVPEPGSLALLGAAVAALAAVRRKKQSSASTAL